MVRRQRQQERRNADGEPACDRHMDGLERERRLPQHHQQGENGRIPVSYTHLDVYKRQPPTDVDALGMDDTATTAVLGEAEGEPPGR